MAQESGNVVEKVVSGIGEILMSFLGVIFPFFNQSDKRAGGAKSNLRRRAN